MPIRLSFLAVMVVALLNSVAAADVALPAIFGEGMVLQRHKPVTIWGSAEAGEAVRVSFGDQVKETTADDAGRWRVALDAMQASGDGRTLRVQSGGDVVEIGDVLVGEVWIGSGQSNMEWTMQMVQNEDAIEAAGDEKLRLFTVEKAVADAPRRDVPVAAEWSPTTPESVRHFSAVAYYFGDVLRRELEGDVPVGLVVTAWGGTPAEAWTSLAELESKPSLQPLLERWDSAIADDADQAGSPHRPANLYNAMLAPLTDLSIRGAIWYQGESNVTRAYQYRTIFPLMIDAWRRAFGQGNFPFYFVQIAPYDYNTDPALAAELWEAQLMTLKAVDNTGMAVTTDIGNIRDIHPRNKRDVGRRLAAWALAYTYGYELTPSGPIYTHHAIDGDRVRLHFDYADGLKSSDGEPLSHFTVAGADGEFHSATAEVEGDTLIVSSDAVDHPIAVRFAWEDTAEPNFVNGANLPASPFRTDSFPLLTRENH